MRLVCPNCDAEYEVADDAIPDTGRDVQCSNCGHAWFQMSLEREAEEEAASAVFDPPPGFELPQATPPAARVTTLPVTSAVVAPSPEPRAGAGGSTQADPDLTIPGISHQIGPVPILRDMTSADPSGPDTGNGFTPQPAPRTIDDSVLAVLREEAEREIAARRDETIARRDEVAPRVETQTEMPLAPPPGPAAGSDLRGAARHIARMKGLDPDVANMATPMPRSDPLRSDPPMSDPQRPAARRDLLPDIEEINSTLRASNDRSDAGGAAIRRGDAVAASGTPGREGFRSGFILTLLVAVLLVASYAMAPRLASQFPQAAGALEGYVAAIDAARLWLDGSMRSVIGLLEG